MPATRSRPEALPANPRTHSLDRLQERIARVSEAGALIEDTYRSDVDPLVRALMVWDTDREHVLRIAVALVRAGRDTGVDPRLLMSILIVENPWLDPVARSPVGAIGLMQVMPFHAGNWDCGSDDLFDPEVNICHGARIFAYELGRTGGNVDRALLAYNGCVRGTNTPDCHLYPLLVLRRAGEAWLLDPKEENGSAPRWSAGG